MKHDGNTVKKLFNFSKTKPNGNFSFVSFIYVFENHCTNESGLAVISFVKNIHEILNSIRQIWVDLSMASSEL
jgi:hypothetical protein